MDMVRTLGCRPNAESDGGRRSHWKLAGNHTRGLPWFFVWTKDMSRTQIRQSRGRRFPDYVAKGLEAGSRPQGRIARVVEKEDAGSGLWPGIAYR